MNADVATLLIDLEAQLRQLGLWDEVPPSAEALASTQPFAIDTLTLPQWLQFIFLPRIYQLLEAGEALPRRCGITPIAEEYFRESEFSGTELLATLSDIDSLLSVEDD